ncbi:hypothetical protein C0Q70_15758 [Pomacea canaliculata]|uniref:BTB domain-containing protein n=2 Tax=Pomacea canaliculata TaxID=400727 RepID=A0A2T7NVR0_POMCA|nr:hypothetical protein C0Q70_15758 [Pomacea canaliculata]
MQQTRNKLVTKEEEGGMHIINKNAGNNVLANLQDFRTKGILYDVVLKIEDQMIFAHRSILAISSEYFRAMFVDHFKEHHTLEVTLESVSAESAASLVDYMYTGQLNVTKEGVQYLIVVADQWQMTDVKDLCAKFMEQQLEPANCLGYKGEDVVLEAVMRWVNHSYDSRIDNLTKTATSVLKEVVESQLKMPKQQRSTQAMIVVIGGFLQPRTGPKNPRLQGVEKIDPRSNSWSSLADFPMKSSGAVALNLRGHLFCLAYEPVENRRGATLVTETRIFEFDLVKNQWLDARSNFSDQVLTCIDECLQASGAVTVCEETSVIYTVSGTEVCRIPFTELDGNIFCKQVHYLPKPAEYMSPSHCMHSAIVVNQNLYVLGGGDKAQRSDTVPSNIVIMFDPSEGVWTRKNGMIEQRLKMDVATINGQIYASGGFNIHRLNTVECYNPQTDMWLRVQHMNWGRSHHKMLALNGRLWAIGGKSYSSGNQAPRDVLNSCEVYDPDQNKWTEGPSMRHARCNFAATVL